MEDKRRTDLMDKVCGLFMQAVAEHFDKCLDLQQEIREEVYDWYFKIDALERELEYVKAQLEDANNELNLTRLYLENVNEIDGRLDPADYADLPFPDVEDVAPAEEVEGSDE